MYTTHLSDELIIGSFDKGRSSSLHQTNAGINVQNKIIDLNIHDKIKYIFVETHERFSHKLGLETAKLKLRINNLNINNINLDWV